MTSTQEEQILVVPESVIDEIGPLEGFEADIDRFPIFGTAAFLFAIAVMPGAVSPGIVGAAADSFQALTNMMLSKDSRTLEQLVQEMLRPMLKDWLDRNLPVIVERLVKDEIERVSRGGR